MLKLISLLLAVALLTAGCGGDDGDSVSGAASAGSGDASNAVTDPDPGDSPDSDDPTGDGVDDGGQGRAFPDDPDFREAICRPLMAMTELIGTDVEIDPEWGSRVSMAILDYADRDAAMAELAAVLAEIEAAIASVG